MTETGLGVFFGEDDQDEFYDAESQVVSKSAFTKPLNSAAGLTEPPHQRGATGLMGLHNQGATCYMNSLFQILHLTPEFRQLIFQLPLCVGSVDKSSDFLDSENKRKFLFVLQKLFTEMQSLNELYINTEQLTDAFGWHDNQQLIQQDIQELNNVLFGVIERALEGTQFFSQLTDYYLGQTVRKLKCTECGDIRSTPESFSSLTAYIQNTDSIEESLNQQFTTVEKMYGDNKIECETCGKKTDHEISHKVRKLPSILNVTLGRFIFDMQKLDRIKVNKRQTFPLQLDISQYRENPEEKEDKNIYELKAVIVHRGTAHGGHYFTYVRDQLGEGDWNLKIPEIYDSEPVVMEQSEEEKKKKEEEQKKKQEDLQKKEDEKKEKVKAMEKELQDGRTSKAQKKRLRKQIKEMQKQKAQTKEQTETKPAPTNFNYEKCDFPIPYHNKNLRKGWFCLNDSSVFPIQLGVLQRQFGTEEGSHENAYSLIYKQRALPKIESVQIPPYFVEHMTERNAEMQKKRDNYYDLMEQLDVIIQPNTLFNIHSDVILRYESDSMIEEQGIRVRLRFNDELSVMRAKVEEAVNKHFGNHKKLEMYEIERMKSGYCHIIRDFSKVEEEKLKEAEQAKQKEELKEESKEDHKYEIEPDQPLTLRSNYVTHFSTWLLLDPSSKDYDEVKTICQESVGKDNEPFDLKISYNDQEYEFIYFRGTKMSEFKRKVQDLTGLLPAQQKLSLVANAQMNRIDHKLYDNQGNEATLKYVGFPLKCVVFVEKRSNEEQMALQEAAKEMQEQSEKPVDLEQLDTPIRSILLDFEDATTDDGPERFYVDMKTHTLKMLVQRCLEFMKVHKSKPENQGSWRMRRLVDKKLFYAEQLDTILWDLNEDFRQGGMRLKLERGNFPALDQYAVNIGMYVPQHGIDVANAVDLIRKADSTVGELKREACLALGIQEDNIQEYKLYRVDAYDEPGEALRRENLQLNATNIDSGDCLCLKNKEELLYSEKIFIHLFHSENGNPDQDVLKVAEISVSKEISLADLKTEILELPFFSQRSALPVQMVRLRERAKTLAFGPILKGHDKTLKKLNVQQNISLIVQILEEPQDLTAKTYKIFSAFRDNEKRNYGKKIEVTYTYEGEIPIFPQLFACLTEPFMELLPEAHTFEVAKFINYNFYWQHVNQTYLEAESMKQATKGKKKKKQKVDPALHSVDKIDVRKMPILLKDGDIFGVKVVDPSGEEEKELDFQTQEDLLRRKQQEEMRELLKQNQNQSKKEGKNKKTEQAVVINAGF